MDLLREGYKPNPPGSLTWQSGNGDFRLHFKVKFCFNHGKEDLYSPSLQGVAAVLIIPKTLAYAGEESPARQEGNGPILILPVSPYPSLVKRVS